jgi:hypothetical protein
MNRTYTQHLEEKKKSDGISGFFSKQRNLIKKLGGDKDTESKNVSND